MTCPACGSDNPATNRFCGGCGSALARGCPACAVINPPGHRFCGGCGAALLAAEPGPKSDREPAGAGAVAARKIVSVVFADLIGSTALHERLDAESVRGLMGRYYGALHAAVEGELDARLEALRRSDLVEPDAGWFLGEPALRFHHGLIRDAAYRRVLKGTRAELHGRAADWIESRVGDAVEHDETIGWHPGAGAPVPRRARPARRPLAGVQRRGHPPRRPRPARASVVDADHGAQTARRPADVEADLHPLARFHWCRTPHALPLRATPNGSGACDVTMSRVP
jgi:hypothetical protein